MLVTAEIKEAIVNSFAKTFDKDMAYDKHGLSLEQRTELDEDQEFLDRLNYFLIEEREQIITRYRKFMDSLDDKIAYKATQDFARLIYTDFFKNLGSDKQPINLTVNNNNGSTGESEDDRRIEEEYGHILGNPKTFTAQRE